MTVVSFPLMDRSRNDGIGFLRKLRDNPRVAREVRIDLDAGSLGSLQVGKRCLDAVFQSPIIRTDRA